MRTLHLFLFFILVSSGWTQEGHNYDLAWLARKDIRAVRTNHAPRIDGHPDDTVWRKAPVAGDFVEHMPRNKARPPYPTEIRFLYDNSALYVLAVMYDPHPDSICRELGRRDQLEALNNDYISVDILPYNDGLNMYEFKVNPSNIQHECKYSAVGQDIAWDAVWESATAISDSAWVAEMRFPWSALRFPATEEQVWGINMWRNHQRYQEYSTWSWVDNNAQDIFRYYGTLSGIRNIDPPLRLSVSPYLSGYVEKHPGHQRWSNFLRGGMDLRLGLNESYTLDMMLIPDFGQVQSDDQVLNLTPFEIRYDEKRQFFTEGTELFNKCNLFYTRRVGSTPRDYSRPYDSLGPHEKVDKNPDQTKIINATKISGRNSKGLGIGFFNGMTTNTYADVLDTLSGEKRRVMTQPFTNYNVLVFDQNLKNNSYVTLINTNYYIPDDGYNANVTGAETRIRNKKGNFSVFGRFNLSQKYREHAKPALGHYYVVSVGKPSGKFRFELLRSVMNDTYDINDMGFLTYNNEANNSLTLSWNDYEPKGLLLNTESRLEVEYNTLSTGTFKSLDLNLSNSIRFNNFWNNYLEVSSQPAGYTDFYEPRVWGRVYKVPYTLAGEWSLNSDNRKHFRYQHNLGFETSPENHHFSWWVGLVPRFRFSDRFSVTLQVQYECDQNNYGWVNMLTDSTGMNEIIFGRRDILTFNNILSTKYIFSPKISLSLRARHYWSQAKYLAYSTLQDDGSLSDRPYDKGSDINFNSFSADLQLVWYFAPGSELSVVWKNDILTMGDQVRYRYFDELGRTLSSPQTNSFSFRVLYYLDYLMLRKKR